MRESHIVFRRQIRMNLRNPAWVLIGMMQPVLYLLLFGPLLKPLVDAVRGADNAYTFLVPGLLVQLGMFGAFFAGFSLIGEWREGVIEAERVTPASRTALLVGRLLPRPAPAARAGPDPGRRSATRSACARRSRGWCSASLLTLLIGGACAAASNALALTTKSEDVMAPVINMVMMPVLLLSGILLPMTIGPAWLQTASDFMPFRHVVDAVRDSFAGDLGSSGVCWGTAWALALFGLAVWWGTSAFRKENS